MNHFPGNTDVLREECGIITVVNHPDAPSLTAVGLSALQHRGQESAGLAVSDGHVVRSHKDMGYVSDVLTDPIVAEMNGHNGIGHVRYSTTGSSNRLNAQPIHVNTRSGSLAIAHNGNLVNASRLRREMELKGSIFNTTNDSEVILHLMARSPEAESHLALRDALQQVQGAFSLVVIDTRNIMVARDPRGFRPLCLGRIGESWVAASETCALDLIGASYERDVEPGEMVVFRPHGRVESLRFAERVQPAMCVFEYVYFSRPDSLIYGRSVEAVRRRQGEILGKESPCDADLVMAVPDSSNTASLGYARTVGLPWEPGLIRNHYVGRTFIRPSQEIRDYSVRKKYNPVKHILEGKRIVLVDDSIVRGTTMRKLVKMVRQAGATEVHLRISSPPITHSCHYGIDTPVRKELIASSHSVEEIEKFLGVDSLRYLSLEGLLESAGNGGDLCRACFTGDYPLSFEEVGKDVFELSSGTGEEEEAEKRVVSRIAGQSPEGSGADESSGS